MPGIAPTCPIQNINIHLMVSDLFSPISLRIFAMSSFVARVLMVASTDLSVLLSIYLNIASVSIVA